MLFAVRPRHAAVLPVQRLPDLLHTLRQTPPASGVLSAYLASSAPYAPARGYLKGLRERADALRLTLPTGAREAFERAIFRAERLVAEIAPPYQPGIALFTAADPAYVHAVALPRWPEELVIWQSEPALAPLERALEDAERVAAVLIDRRRVRIVSIFLGRVEERLVLESELPDQQLPDGGPTAHAKGARCQEGHILPHARRVVRETLNLLHRRPFDWLLLSGPAEARALLREQLPRPLRARLAGTLTVPADAPDEALLSAVRLAFEAIERQTEVALVQELIDGARVGQAVVGLPDTLGALSEQCVRRLFVAENLDGVASECTACGRLLFALGPCPVCGSRTTPLPDLRERVLARALSQGARIELVSGEAAARLGADGGVGAGTLCAAPRRVPGPMQQTGG